MTQSVNHPPVPKSSESVGELVSRASEQVSQLVRDELRLAQAEMKVKGRRFGKGGGLLGAAGAIGYAGLLALAATGMIALALVLPLWAAALIVTGVLLALAAVLGAMGKKELARSTPPAPEQAIDGIKADVAEIKEKSHR